MARTDLSVSVAKQAGIKGIKPKSDRHKPNFYEDLSPEEDYKKNG
jgi:hypothetical protein